MNPSMSLRLNKQINAELYSSYLYLAMSAYCASKSLNGFAHWFRLQAQEEQMHGLKIYDFVIDREGEIRLESIAEPLSRFESIVDVFEKAHAHEKHVTTLLNDLAGFAQKENDYATAIFLQWFITEQIEEEATVRDILERLKMIGSSGDGLLMMDHALGQRATAPASSET